MPFDVVSYMMARRALRRLEEHRSRTPIDHPDLSITRSKMEYPTEDVWLSYLKLIGKADEAVVNRFNQYVGLYTVDNFSDKALLRHFRGGSSEVIIGRRLSNNDLYKTQQGVNASTADHVIFMVSAGSVTTLASEAVDLDYLVHYLYILSITGSTLKSFRDDMSAPKISATDTTFASGVWGLMYDSISNPGAGNDGILMAPLTRLPQAIAIVEAEVVGRGTEDDPIRPGLAQDVRGDRDYLSVSWGAFDHRPGDSHFLVVIFGGNQYTGGKAVEKQAEHARSRNLKALSPPRDYAEAVEQYRRLRRDYPDWLAGKDNYAYQTLGYEVLEAFQAADFYYGELVEHRTHYHQLRMVPDWEVRKALAMWRRRLEGASGLNEERERHLKKLAEVERLGW